MDAILQNLKTYYNNNINNNIYNNIYNLIKDFIKDNNNQILLDFFNKLILLLIDTDYNLIIKDKEEISNIIKDIASKNVIFNMYIIYDEHQSDFFQEVKNYNVRGLLIDIISEYYHIDKSNFEIFSKIPARDLFDAIISNEFLIRDDNRLMYLKYNSKFLKNTFPHIDDKTLINIPFYNNTFTQSNFTQSNFTQSLFIKMMNYYSYNNNYEYNNIKNVLKHQLGLFKNSNVEFKSNELKNLINNKSQIEILKNFNRNTVIKKAFLINLSIIKAYIIDILIENNIVKDLDLFKDLKFIKAQLYGDVIGQLKYFSSFLRKNYPNENDENLKLYNWNEVYSYIDKHIKFAFFENEDNYIKSIINNLTFWHTEHYLSIFKNAPEALKSYSHFFINNSDINQILKKFDSNLTFIDNKSKFIINDSQYLVMKDYEDSKEFKNYINDYDKLLSISPTISYKTREMCIDWLVGIYKKYQYVDYNICNVDICPKITKKQQLLDDVFLPSKNIRLNRSLDTLYITICLLDKYLYYKNKEISLSDIKIIILTCFSLASKYYDFPIFLSTMVNELNRNNNTIPNKEDNKKTLVIMNDIEIDILNMFNYSIYIPTILYFANIYMENINIYISEEDIKLLYYMLELTLQYSQFIKFKFSIIAISAIYLIVKNNKNTVDSLFTISDTTFDNFEIKNCINFLLQIVKLDIKSSTKQNIRLRYINEYNILKNRDLN